MSSYQRQSKEVKNFGISRIVVRKIQKFNLIPTDLQHCIDSNELALSGINQNENYFQFLKDLRMQFLMILLAKGISWRGLNGFQIEVGQGTGVVCIKLVLLTTSIV